MILADLTINGKPRKVLMQAPKNGYFYVLDRKTGKLISAEKHAAANWAERIDLKTGRAEVRESARYRDGTTSVLAPVGDGAGDGWQPPAFDPRRNVVYFHSSSAAQSWQDDPEYKFVRGYFNGGVVRTPQRVAPEDAGNVPAQGYTLLAWDPIGQKPVWRQPQQGFRNGGLLATGGNLLFGGEDKSLVAYDAATGKPLWSAPEHNHALAAPISYAVGGKQYVALVVGTGFSTIQTSPVPYPAQMPNTNRVLVFALDGHDKMPDDVFPQITLPPPPTPVGTSESVAQGQRAFTRYCYYCHGPNALGDRVHPDLRFSDVLANKDDWQAIVRDGARAELGMAAFDKVLTPDLAEAIRAFVISQSRNTRTAPSTAPRQVQ
jgi:mono/diheme cytochrome c family protein